MRLSDADKLAILMMLTGIVGIIIILLTLDVRADTPECTTPNYIKPIIWEFTL
jgi:hypothetical protein